MNDPFFVRNLVYGVEDSLISTSGVVVGMSMAGMSHHAIVITGAILVFVESLSMAFGSFISEDSFMLTSNTKHTWKDVIKYSAVMLGSYVLAGLIPMLPFLLNVPDAWQWSVVGTLLALFGLIYGYKKKTQDALVLTSIAGFILTLTIITANYLR